jgi:hypothetical protein
VRVMHIVTDVQRHLKQRIEKDDRGEPMVDVNTHQVVYEQYTDSNRLLLSGPYGRLELTELTDAQVQGLTAGSQVIVEFSLPG